MRILALLALIVLTYAASKDDDHVDKQALLDYIKVEYSGEMYSGYLPIDGTDIETAFHYYFMTATVTDDGNLPVLLWLNGGPGCSSLQGALNENGPFVFEAGTSKVFVNEYAWTKFSHMIFLESPAKVGFSYGDDKVDDDLVAKQNLNALINFFIRFPEYQTRDFYIAGESYAGIYIPTLANEIVEHNKAAGIQFTINLKGVAIGNGCTDPTECTAASEDFPQHVLQFFGRHGLIDDADYQEFRGYMEDKKCVDIKTKECVDLATKIMADFNAKTPTFLFNPYNIYGYCWNQKLDINGERIYRSNPRLTKRRNLTDQDGDLDGDCVDAFGIYTYLRDPAWLTLTKIDTTKSSIWHECSEIKYTVLDKASYYLYPLLIKAGVKILKFSGDIDSVVPITGTLFWLDKLQMEYGLATIEPWRPWYVPPMKHREGIDADQNAGNVWVLDGITFVSVRNAGHMVPTDKRQEAMIMMDSFIKNTPLPTKRPKSVNK